MVLAMRFSHRARRGHLFRSTILAIALAFLSASTAYLAHVHREADVVRQGAATCDLCAQLGGAGAPPTVVAFAAAPLPVVERAILFRFPTLPVRRVVASLLPRGPPAL
jgi:hypothetical protein